MSWKDDAYFVGIAARGLDWEVALRVARSVEPGAGNGGDRKTGSARSDQDDLRADRVSCARFAKAAKGGISDHSVKNIYLAWQLAAGENAETVGLPRISGLPNAESLTPDSEFTWAGYNFRDYYKAILSIGRWLLAEANWEAEEAERQEEDLRAIAAGANPAAEVFKEKPSTAGIHDKGEAILDETVRRERILAVLNLAEQMHEQWNVIASEHSHTGVADEAEWLHATSAHLTEIQWGIQAFVVESVNKDG